MGLITNYTRDRVAPVRSEPLARMDVSIITPSLNMLEYLKRCRASVADQQGASFEHIVVDGGSTDGTVEWLRSTTDVVGVVEPDNGMYDAINKGFRLARGKVIAYLNCDEQYLPDVFSTVKRYFETHPDIDILVGDTLLIRPDGSLISFRKTYPLPLTMMLAGQLQMQTSSIFFRRRIFDAGEYFDPRFKDAGDFDFVVRLMRKNYRFGFCRTYFSAFTMTGFNKGGMPNMSRESRQLLSEAPTWVTTMAGALRLVRWGLKLLRGAYFERMPIKYSVYESSESSRRRQFVAHTADFRWREA
jgi:glycosyltransferase involved in cell wall biosynthesis